MLPRIPQFPHQELPPPLLSPESQWDIARRIEEKVLAKKAFDDDDLRFLYEIDAPIEGWDEKAWDSLGDVIDAVQRILDPKKDLSRLLGIDSSFISTSREEALLLGSECVWHHGDLNLSDITHIEYLTLPRRVHGTVFLESLVSAESFLLPERLDEGIQLSSLQSLHGIVFPKLLGDFINLKSLPHASFQNLELPSGFSGRLYLPNAFESFSLVASLRMRYPRAKIILSTG